MMRSIEPKPTLSICIPTCNRAHFLRVMLEALLPQVLEFKEDVEVWILDNGSSDTTKELLIQLASLGPFNVLRRNDNVGPVRNLVEGPLKLARGEYVWVLGDHNLLRPQALKTILEAIKGPLKTDLFYVNFRVGVFPKHWPESAHGGYDGEFQYIGNSEIREATAEKWYSLLKAQSAACTQSYVHIVKTTIWQEYWENRDIGRDFSSAETTYPHTMAISQSYIHSPVTIITIPCFTIFNGAQSWGDPNTKLNVLFVGFTELLGHFKERGVPREVLTPLWNEFFLPAATNCVQEVLQNCGRIRGSFLVTPHLGLNYYNWKSYLSAFLKTIIPQTLKSTGDAIVRRVEASKNYLYNFRVSRWLRARKSKRNSS
jgi:glycosyltransferase involved in cell wall biosynthesis